MKHEYNAVNVPPYIIIQAGGKGTRLKQYTRNKPKAIVSIDNLPMVFHLFRKFPESKYIIIGDYLKDVLDSYLDVFSDVQYITVGTGGYGGTCSGIKTALRYIPDDMPFMLIWSDLILGPDFSIPSFNQDYVGISGTFRCRWSYTGTFQEIPSDENGVAGLFIFTSKSKLNDVPLEGEFVRWLQSEHLDFNRISMGMGTEYGLVEKINVPESGKCRPFNHMESQGNVLVKTGVDEQGKKLAVREKAWYRHVMDYDVNIPHIFGFEPLTMEKINGKNIYEYDFIREEKLQVLKKIVGALNHLHEFDKSSTDYFSMYEAYYLKTVNRLSKIRTLVPFANQPYIIINGKKCRNVFFHLSELREKIKAIKCNHFCLIHGDCTFSNMMLRDDKEPVFIDPRGYFGKSEIVGDPNYDWAKFYYSLRGDYDKFNLGKFVLEINKEDVVLEIESNGWSDVEKEYFDMLPDSVIISDIKLIHAIIWLSLTTYAWNDYDSICGAFYNGLLYLEDVL